MKAVEPGDWVMVVRISDGDTAAAAWKWAEHLVGMHGVVREVRGGSWARVRLDKAVDWRLVWRISLLDLELWTRPQASVPYADILYCGVMGDRGRVLHALADRPMAAGQYLTLCGVVARAVWQRRGLEPLPWSAAYPSTCMQCARLEPLTRAREPGLAM
jgi:hypothetical protein